MIRCVIIDDEPLAISLLEAYVKEIDQLELLNTFTNPIDFIHYCQTNSVDLVFLDIHMPELNGVQVAKIIHNQSSIIFTTAYTEYAIDGFEINAIDYLVKPISFERFQKAVTRKIEKSSSIYLVAEQEFIFVKVEHRLQKVDLNSIVYLKGMGDYVQLITEEQELIMTLENMKSFEERLPVEFIRVHKSYIVQLSKIKYIRKQRIYFENDDYIPIGKTYEEEFLKRIK